MENRLSELFPIQSIGPLIGGLLIWFAANYLYLGPELIGPRLAAKYYMPACLETLHNTHQAYAEETRSLVKGFELDQTALADKLRGRVQQGADGFFQMLLGGRPGSEEYFKKHGATVQGWSNNMAGMGSLAVQQSLDEAKALFSRRMAERDKEARKGVIYPAPVQFCGCVMTEGMKERVELAAFTASLRLYTPPAIRRFEDGTMLHEAKACGTLPRA